MTSLVAASIAFRRYGVRSSCIFLAAPRNPLPSMAICIPRVFNISPIQFVIASETASSSKADKTLDIVDNDGTPLDNMKCPLTCKTWIYLRYLRWSKTKYEGLPHTRRSHHDKYNLYWH